MTMFDIITTNIKEHRWEWEKYWSEKVRRRTLLLWKNNNIKIFKNKISFLQPLNHVRSTLVQSVENRCIYSLVFSPCLFIIKIIFVAATYSQLVNDEIIVIRKDEMKCFCFHWTDSYNRMYVPLRHCITERCSQEKITTQVLARVISFLTVLIFHLFTCPQNLYIKHYFDSLKKQ